MVRARDRMYSDWLVLPVTQDAKERCISVLQKFPCAAGRDVVTAVVHSLAANLGISSSSCEPSTLVSDVEVNWCMEVMCFGLQLPLSEHEAIRDCVHVYCEWLQALTQPKPCVPRPVQDDANQYVRRMLWHLYNLFVPREDGQSSDTISRQAVLCHRVLRRLQSVAQESTIIEKDTWDEILLFLLAISDTLLAPPSGKDDIGSHLCERILTVLFEVWLLACQRCFPSPNLWKTLRELCCTWRHRAALVVQWNRVNSLLTARMLRLMYGHHYPEIKLEEDAHLLPPEMCQENVAQAWYRFLHVLGDPVDLCRPEVISQTPGFYSLLERNDTIVDPFQNPCLAALPHIFHRAMAGLATLVDAFLGISHTTAEDEHQKTSLTHSSSASATSTAASGTTTTPPHQRRGANKISAIPNFKGMSKPGVFSNIRSGSSSSSSSSSSASAQPPLPCPASSPSTAPLPPFLRSTPSSMRPRCNSILHLYGSWLFEAVLVGSELDAHAVNASSTAPSESGDSAHSHMSSLLESASTGPRSTGGAGSLPGMPDSIEIPPCLSAESFEAGQAEAAGALCRLFCSKRTREEILPVYFARFYLSLRHVLSNTETKSQVVASVLLNSCDLFRQDTEGVNVLLPLFIHALESVFCPDKESKIRSVPNVSQVELRLASTHLLLSMLPLPLHYGNLQFKDFGSGQTVTFQSLRPRLMSLLIGALQNETDSTNTQMLLGGLLFCVQDATAYEEANQVTQPYGQEIPTNLTCSNLLCSDDDGFLRSYGTKPHGLTPELEWNTNATDNLDSASALFVRAIYLVCHRLLTSWMTDMHVSLAALDVLSGLAKVHRTQQDSPECRRAVKWICDFVVFQCQRPPPAHSRDLHSTIVAAFQCLTVWLVEHPLLLQDKESVHYVLEVVELGISGSKSQPKMSDVPLMKAEKELKPSSLRVRDAAEAVLSCMMDHVGYFPNPAGPEALSSLLNEETLLKYSNANLTSLTPEAVGKHFRYFVTQNSAIVAILEQNLGNDQGALPTVTLLVRVPFGRHAWTMQLRHLPRHKSESCGSVPNPGRPAPCYDRQVHSHPPPSYFPESVEDIPVCEIDKSIPDLASTPLTREQAQMLGFIDQQAKMEKSVCRQWEDAMRSQEFPNPETECKAPGVCREFQTARLFLSHFGFLWDDFGKLQDPTSGYPLMALDNGQQGFYGAVDSLDNIPSRTNDTMFVFYVKDGQTSANEILNNVTSSRNVHPQFLEFLRSLGWPVDVGMHTGWTGNPATSWKVTSDEFNIADLPSDHGGSLYSGHHQVLYWSDVLSEIVVIVPSPNNIPKDDCEVMLRPKAESCSERPTSGADETVTDGPAEKSRAMSLNYELDDGAHTARPPRSRQARFTGHAAGDLKVLVVWLESFEDHVTFPLGELLPATTIGQDTSSSSGRNPDRDLLVLFVHALQSSLFRIKIQGRGTKTSQALPLIDGMVVSRRVLGIMVRQTALSLCRRRRLEAEMCLPPHVRRRMKIQDIGKRFQQHQTRPELHERLFRNTF